MKDVVTCDKPREGGNTRRSEDLRMGKPFRCQHRKRPAESIGGYEQTQGSEPSQYLEEKKATAIPLVAASESGTAQTQPS